ncbi:MAG: S9 family peptidase [Deltaproteobacteria bacterium]|nr:S9 family peptidase [Deltaproteobacteria bacterium]
MILALVFVGVTVTSCAHRSRQGDGSDFSNDPFQWLEQIESPAALKWAQVESEKTLNVLEQGPRYARIESDVRKILLAKDRIPTPIYRGGYVYNFWQDEKSVRGLWRRTTLESYAKKSPRWEVVLDLDKLALAEKENWVWKRSACLPPTYNRCLLHLSRGGKDATVVREFDVTHRQFVKDGFVLPEAKTDISWIDPETVMVATDLGPDSLTLAGYPRFLKLWKRGTSLVKAPVVFESPKTDDEVGAETLFTVEDVVTLIVRRMNFFESETWVFDPEKLTRAQLPVPPDAFVDGYYRGNLLVRLRQEWKVGPKTFAAGSLVSMGVGEGHSPEPQLVYAPGERVSIRQVAVTKDSVLIGILDNVKGRILEARGSVQGQNLRWRVNPLRLGASGMVEVASADSFTDVVMTSHEDFLKPTTLMHGGKVLKQLPSRFNAKGLVSQQFEASSADGTKIPYFVVHDAKYKLDGSNPTMLYGYGGFEIPMTPAYSAVVGKVWLEHGGVYALANIRGGGEFGPRWHQAALKENRQRAYDDFIAVAQDLIARKITSPAKLGIMGGSNGGLLMGAVVTQRPELFGAVVCKVPLLDMLRYHRLLAGHSWVAEYGDPDDPGLRQSILKYSPYQNVKRETRYPDVFFETSTKDDRVHPGHARKMVALMESQGHHVYYFENNEGGHGAAANLEQRIHMTSLDYSYLSRQLGVH